MADTVTSGPAGVLTAAADRLDARARMWETHSNGNWEPGMSRKAAEDRGVAALLREVAGWAEATLPDWDVVAAALAVARTIPGGTE